VTSLAWTGTEYGVSWSDSRDGGSQEIYFARLDATGAKIGSDVRVTNNAYYDVIPKLVWNGTEYGLLWRIDVAPSLNFARLSSTGTKLGPDVAVSGHNSVVAGNIAIRNAGSVYGVSWVENDGYQQLHFNRIGDLGPIPTLTWSGMILMASLLLMALAWHIRRKRYLSVS
jgi:hypothetical protein